jgi:hypothetical protein
MKSSVETAACDANHVNLCVIDGTDSHKSYGVVARRGDIFLGIKFSGLTDGSKFGAPGKTYLHARVRSARDQGLAEELDLGKDPSNVVSFLEKQLGLDEAWPSFSFDKLNDHRASLLVGMFIEGTLPADASAIAGRIEQGDLFGKIVEFMIEQVGPEKCIADADLVTAWLSVEAKPLLQGLKALAEQHKLAAEVKKEFAANIEAQLEVAGQHQQQLKAIYLKHKQAGEDAILA